jgi:hypothetical protein
VMADLIPGMPESLECPKNNRPLSPAEVCGSREHFDSRVPFTPRYYGSCWIAYTL